MTRPEVLKDPEPQGRLERRELVCDALAPLLVSLHVVDDAHIDHSSLRFLLAQNLAAQRVKVEKEQQARRQVLLQEFSALLAVPVRSRSLLQVSRLEALAEALDNDSSFFLPAGEEEEEEEEETSTSFWCADTTLWARVLLSLFVAVFPFVVDRPEMLGIMAGMYQMDSSSLVVVFGSGMCIAGLAGYDTPRVMFLSGVARPWMLCIVADMGQKG